MAGIRIDFEKMTEKGLQPLVKRFKKLGLDIESVTASNKPKRELGFQLKTAEFLTYDGQKLAIKVKSDGSIAQAKLNNKVLAIKSADNLDKAMIEVVDFIQANEKKFAKRRSDQLKRVRVPRKIPEVRTSRAEKIEKARAAVEEITANLETLQTQSEQSAAALENGRSTLSALELDIAKELERQTALEKELAGLKEAA